MTSPSNFQPTARMNQNIPIVSPVGSTVLVGTASVPAIGFNQNRRGLIFINPSSTVTLYVCPANQAAVAGQGTPILPGGQQTFLGNADLNIAFNCGWNAIASGGSNNPLTVLELV